MTTTSHANCTHEKTKAARAACRKAGATGITVGEMTRRRIADNATDSPRANLRAKAAPAAEKLGPPKAEGEIAKAVSGFCGNGNHERCPGGGHQWSCSCDCHKA